MRTVSMATRTELVEAIGERYRSIDLLIERARAGSWDEFVALEAWRSLRSRAVELDRQLIASARQNEASALLMSIPGVGAVTASSYVAAVEDPANFRSSRSVGAWLGLTTRRYQSGEVDYGGHISCRGDVHLRALLYEAATTILTRVVANSTLCAWGLKLREKLGFKRATVAVARKLAVIMHSMLKSGQPFDRLAVSAA